MLQIQWSDSPGLDCVVSERFQEILRKHGIDEKGPGTILPDFEALLQFVGEDGLQTSGKYNFIPQKQLEELNLRMTHPVAHKLTRPQQRSLPHLHGLYLILRASGMAVVEGVPPNSRLTLDPDTVAAWRALNPTERYFALLTSWLILGAPEILAERGRANACLDRLVILAQRLRDRRTTNDDRRGSVLHSTTDLTTIALMELFGWVKLEMHKPKAGDGVRVAAIERLEFGDAMVNTLGAAYVGQRVTVYDDEIPEPDQLLELFQPFFAEYERTLVQPQQPYRDGKYVFRVSLGKAWRRIAAPDDANLDALTVAILEAFEFDDDHLYCFELLQKNGRKLRIACPYEREAAAFTDDVVLGELSIPVGGEMTMVFDYGDEWHFKIKLEEVGPSADLNQPTVIEKKGKAPAQYDEEWD